MGELNTTLKLLCVLRHSASMRQHACLHNQCTIIADILNVAFATSLVHCDSFISHHQCTVTFGLCTTQAKYQYKPKESDGSWAENYHRALYNLTDEAIRGEGGPVLHPLTLTQPAISSPATMQHHPTTSCEQLGMQRLSKPSTKNQLKKTIEFSTPWVPVCSRLHSLP